MSLRDGDGKNIFALLGSETDSGRGGAKYEDTKFISEAAEQFLAGILDGLPDGEHWIRAVETKADGCVLSFTSRMTSAVLDNKALLI